MIIENLTPTGAPALPRYLGATRYDDEIIGVGADSILIIDDSLQMITYCQALRSGSIAAIGIAAHPRRANSLHYSELLRQFATLTRTPEHDDLGRIRPSIAAIEMASEVAFRILRTGSGVSMPADVSVDRDGDLRILWEDGDRTLELVCPFEPARRSYIYYSEGDQYYVAYDLSVYRLGRLFGWLAGRSSRFPR